MLSEKAQGIIDDIIILSREVEYFTLRETADKLIKKSNRLDMKKKELIAYIEKLENR